MAKYIRLTVDEVATAAELAGVSPDVAVATWLKGGKRFPGNSDPDPVENMHAGLMALADQSRSADQEFGAGEPDDEGTEEGTGSANTDEADDMPGFTGPMNGAMTQYDGQHDDAMNTQGSNNYDLEQYIRQLVDDEFKNSNA